MYDLSLCSIMKDEHEEYIREWIEYHHKIGFEYVIIYDNESTIPISNLKIDYNYLNVVNITGYPAQYSAYGHCIDICKQNNITNWLAFLDADEFFVPKKTNDMHLLLKDYEDFAALSVNWAVFGSNDYVKRPLNGTIKNYIMRMNELEQSNSSYNWCKLVKSITKPKYIMGIISPHQFVYKEKYAIGENFDIVNGSFREPPSYNIIQCNHYWTRSKEDLEEKVKKRRSDTGEIRKGWNKEEFDKGLDNIDSWCIIEDKRILDIWNS